MASHLVSAVGDLFKGVYNLLASFFITLFQIVQTFVLAIVHFFTGIVNLFVELVTGLVEVAGGIVNFVLGNIVILGIISAVGYVYVQNSKGRTVTVGGKKVN